MGVKAEQESEVLEFVHAHHELADIGGSKGGLGAERGVDLAGIMFGEVKRGLYLGDSMVPAVLTLNEFGSHVEGSDEPEGPAAGRRARRRLSEARLGWIRKQAEKNSKNGRQLTESFQGIPEMLSEHDTKLGRIGEAGADAVPVRSLRRCERLPHLHKEKNKILRPSETRWLVLHQCVERVLQEWETLKLLFLQAATEDRIVAAELILKDMNPITEAYLKLMQYVLGFFNKLNAMFQSKDSLIAVIQEESQRLLRCLCQNFMKPSSIEDPAILNPLNPRSLLALEELYVGAGCQGILDKITMKGGSSEVRDFKLRCMSFYQTAVLEVQKRLPISGPFFHKVRFVQPSTALYYEARKRLPSLPVLQDRYKHLLPKSEKIELQTKSPDAFWGQVSKTKTFDDKLVLPNIATLAKQVLTLPHSNAETERILSMLSDMKTRKRNRLGPESVNALLLVKSAMATRGETCVNLT
ncbi:hypothetical protein HPB47_001008, partial [Ixodes persulcatus]